MVGATAQGTEHPRAKQGIQFTQTPSRISYPIQVMHPSNCCARGEKNHRLNSSYIERILLLLQGLEPSMTTTIRSTPNGRPAGEPTSATAYEDNEQDTQIQ
ncbi:hypothetical protein Nepgr_002683 [Nepenthes gracilis]|uniref:Uncharacterized protein n=1 Tax=Nepenthes gracilis TaxID=150966 RepID=A0AAD3RXZ6_NEPGR|nr:hypothetical protein Nepgr_002683 [Nepenthes gracilis]